MNQQEEYIKWIDSHIAETKTYHNHKETTAWVATAFYWTSIVVFSSQAPSDLRFYGRVLLFKVVLLVTVAVGIFVITQLSRCRESHLEVRKLMLLKEKILGDLVQRPNIKSADEFNEIAIPKPDSLTRGLLELATGLIIFSGFMLSIVLIFKG